MKIICQSCHSTFSSNWKFNQHVMLDDGCPAISPPKKGESFEKYRQRCEKEAAEWRAKQ